MHTNQDSRGSVAFAFAMLLLTSTPLTSQAQLLWTVGRDDNGWPLTLTGGGPNAAFVQEGGGISPLPGSPSNVPTVPPSTSADNDYYFAGVYTNVIPSFTARLEYGDYTPVGEVLANEEAAERAFAGGDLDQRYHFNLPSTLKTNDMLTVTYDAFNFDTGGIADPRFGVEVYFNGFLVQTQIVIRNADVGTDYTTPQFSLASVNAQTGPGFDNVVSLRGISYSADFGGNWMGIDYVQLNAVGPTNPPPALPLLLAVGRDDNAHPIGDGGGANASFVAESGDINPLPGIPNSPETDLQADNDYYFAGVYTSVIASVTDSYGAYTPVGAVAVNEEAAERAFAGNDNDLRYHFNLPASLRPFDLISVTFDALSLDDPSVVNTDPRYGVEVYFNGVLVQPQILVHPVDLGADYTTRQFRLDSVNAQVGPGFDNIVSLRGINYSTQVEGGGNFMGIDYVQVNAGESSVVDTNAPTVVSVTRYGDVARLKVTFSEVVTAATANIAANYTLGGGQMVTLAVLQADGRSVVLTTGVIPIGTTDTLTVTGVKDPAGNTIGSPGNQLSFSSKYQILLVTPDPGPLTFPGDQAVLQRLQARGFDVTLTTGIAVPNDGSTAVGNDLVIVSSSLTSGDVISPAGGAKFLRSPVPVLVWESAVEDDFRFQALGGTTTNTQTQINMVNASHPLAAGFPAGLLTVTTSPQTFSVGTPVGAHIIATVAADPNLALLYYYDKGERGLTNFVMPARRVFFFFQDNTASAVNAAGTQLFDASVDFAMGVVPTGGTNPPTLPFLWTVGLNDNLQPCTAANPCDGGGANATFVQENGSINLLPGVADSPEADQQADNDYYFAGVYSTAIPSVTNLYGEYVPIGVVAADEEAAERAFAGDDNDLRYHFNLPGTLQPNDMLTVSFDATSLHIDAASNPDPRYGVMVLVNGVLVQPEIVIRPAQVYTEYTTPQFSLASVNAQAGPGSDNIVSLRGVNYSVDGGGNWMGIDYVQVNAGAAQATLAFLPPVVSNGQVTLNWTGTGTLQWAPAATGPWTPFTPAPAAPYSEAIVPGQNRFYRLQQ